jgi:hypothetical protein
MRQLITAMAFGLLSFGAYSGSQACSCSTTGPAGYYRGLLQNTDAVFRGTVLRVQDLTAIPGRDLQLAALSLVVFRVNGAWKGIDQQVVYVFTGRRCCICGYPFEEGKEYVVWATRDDVLAPGELSTDICKSTREVHEASEQLKQLGKPKQVLK